MKLGESVGRALTAGLFAAAFAPSALAAIVTNTWTGAAGTSDWSATGNWSRGAVPDKNTVVVFDTDGSVSTVCSGHIYTYTVLVRQGTVLISTSNGGSNIEIYGANNTSEVWVAENASLGFSTVTFKPGGGSVGATVFRKSGLGTCTAKTHASQKDVLITEGVLVAGERSGSTHYTVRSGAELREGGCGYFNSGYPAVHLDKGAVLQIAQGSQSNESRIRGLTGEGTVYCPNSRSVIQLTGGPYLFSGTVSGAMRLNKYSGADDAGAKMILGSRDVFANCTIEKAGSLSSTTDGDTLRFAPGIGVFRFKELKFGDNATYPIPTEDTDGLPVTLELNCNSGQAKFKPTGTGTLQFGVSMTFKSANALSNFSGALVLTNGTLTLDSSIAQADVANLKGVTAKKGTLSVSGSEALTFDCPVRGAAWFCPNVNMRLNDFCFRGGSISPANGPVATFAGGLASFDMLKFVNGQTRAIAMEGGVLAGPFAVDANLAAVVPTTLKRPCAGISSYENADSGYIQLRGGEIHLAQQSNSKNVYFSALDGGTAYVYSKFTKMPTVAFNGATIAMCPPDTTVFTPFGSAVTVGAGGVTFVSGISGGGAARNYMMMGAAPDGADDGGVTRYGAGSFYTHNAMTITGPFRVLDGVLVVNNSSQMSQAGAAIYGTGSLELGNMKFAPASALWKDLSFGATTVSGGAYLALTAGIVPTFASVTFANGGALFVEEGRTVNFTAAPENAPIFSYSSGTLSTTAYCDAARHLVLNGGTLAEAQDFGAARGVLAVGADASVTASLAGTAGVGFVGPADGTKRRLTLASASTFTGGAFVNALEVVPTVAGALGAGAVTVGAGEWMGGRVRFTSPVTLANDFTVAGWGPVDEQGALVFDASATIGALAVGPYAARVRVNAGATATVSGKLSGGNLQVAGNGGTFEIAGENVLTGRLDVIRATLRVSGATASLGAGDVWLDDATLVFANTAPLTVTNRIYGAGKIACLGKDVNIDTPDLEFSGILRIAPGATATIDRHALLDENLRVYLPAGATLDLDGATRTFDRVSGDGTVRNGNFTCKRPWQRRGCAVFVK